MAWHALALGLLSVLPVVADLIHGDVTFEARSEILVFANQTIEIYIDPGTGAWRQLRDPRSGRTLLFGAQGARDLDVRVGDAWLCADKHLAWRYVGHRTRVDGDSVILDVDREMPGWQATVSYRLWPAKPVVQRDLTLTATSEAAGVVWGVIMSLDGLTVSGADDVRYSLLSNWPPQVTGFDDLRPGRRVQETGGTMGGHFVVVHSQDSGLGAVATMVCETEGAWATVLEQDGAIAVLHEVGAAYRPKVAKGEAFGSQLLCIASGSWRDALRQGRDLYDVVALAPPQDMLPEAQAAVFYSAHAGGTIDSGFQDVGGFAEFAKGLPELKRLGINVLWLLPFWKGPVYAPVDYYSLDERLGTAADLRALVDQAHALGIRVLGDLIPHGPLDESGLHRQHRDWISTTEDGSMQYWWGCLSCDYAHPGWQGFMGEHAAHWVREVGLDGYRVDCAGGGPCNWQPYGGNRPSMSGLYGGMGVLRAARQTMRTVKDKVLLLAEAAAVPLLRYADFYYDWPLAFSVLPSYQAMRAEGFVPRLAQWLDNEQYWLPKGTRLLHFLENHDMIRARMVYGPGPERALMAMCALAPGTPLVYHFQEVGMAPWLSRLYRVRQELPELTAGEADFLSVTSDNPCVLVFTRAAGQDTCLVAINFSQETQKVVLSRQAEGAQLFSAPVDMLSGTAIEVLPTGGLRLELAPFDAAVVVERGRAGLPPQEPPAPPHQAVGHPEVAEANGLLTIRSGRLQLTLSRQHGGVMASVHDTEGHVLVASHSLEEGRRRLWPGAERLSLSTQPSTALTWSRGADWMEATATGTVSRKVGEASRPVVDYRTTYRLSGGSRLGVSHRLTAREPIRNVLGSLHETLQLDPAASEWLICTREGLLHDWAVARHPRDVRYQAIYARGTGDRVWQSRDIPLSWAQPVIAVRGRWGGWTALWVDPVSDRQPPANVMLKMRLGQTAGPHVRLEWLDGTRPVTLERGQSLELRYTLSLEDWDAHDVRTLWRAPRFGDDGSALTFRGTRVEYRNQAYEAAFTRFGGGRLVDFRPRGSPQPLISSSMVYTDVGLYPESTTPDMRKQRTFVSSLNDPEAELHVGWQPGVCTITAEGLLRSQEGRHVPTPRIRYRVSYAMDDSELLRVRVGVKPQITLSQARVFLAQTLSLPRFHSYEVNARAGRAQGVPQPGAQRVWQSRDSGLGAEPWMVCGTGTGQALRIAGPDLARAFQNAFLFRGSGTDGTVFLAFYDLEPADITPVWREAEYTLAALQEAK